MRNFILGVIVTLAVLTLGGLGIALLGFIPTNANATPPKFEAHLAMGAVDASTDHHAAHINSPVLPSAENLIDGMKIYTMNCSGCHGTLDKKPSPLASSFYPPPPQLIQDPPDDADWHNYYVIRNGIRYTGMPAWDKTLTSDDMWKTTMFLSHMDKLPPAVQEYWKTSFGTGPEPEKKESTKGADHDHH